MSTITETDADALFKDCKTVVKLRKCIKDNCHLWFDEDPTLNNLHRAYQDSKRMGKTTMFGTILLSESGPFFVSFKVNPDGTCQFC